ncbi:hypothetical protein AVEN_162984-1 [Araneus ventricosus]|uniref:Uncharacterized protein n=1 Tax=Araneus ventricosus TaxID=182803 RepID=A0A4Y2BZ95_ARAVE|nr:hypothetical protein AVEN_162984-1 [Araneus ventricosus]
MNLVMISRDQITRATPELPPSLQTFPTCLRMDLGLRWSCGKVSAIEPEGSRFETRFYRISVVYWDCCTLNHTGLQVSASGSEVPGSKPDSTEDPPCIGPVAR